MNIKKMACMALTGALVFSGAYALADDPVPAEAAMLFPKGTEMVKAENEMLLPGVSALYSVPDGGIVAEVTARGFESDVVMLAGVDGDGKITGLSVVSQGETPEKGGLVLAEDYLSQFTGASDIEGIDAFSGATGTSNAVFSCVGTALKQYKAHNGIPYEEDLSEEERIAASVAEHLGDGCETVDATVKMISAVYKSDLGYGFLAEKQGFNEEMPVKIIVYLTADGKVSTIDVIEQHETLDNGSQAFGDAYMALYYGGSQFTVFDGLPGTVIDTLTGATESCYSLFQLVNAATMQYSMLTGSMPGLMLGLG